MKSLCYLVALGLMLTTGQQSLRALNIFPVATNSGAINFPSIPAASSSNFLFGYLQNNTNVFVQLVSTNGSLLGSAVSIGTSRGRPHVAFGKTNYLVLWADDYVQPQPTLSLFCQVVSAGGVKVGSPVAVDQLTPDGFQVDAGLAFDGTNFLAIWEDNRDPEPTSTFYAQLIRPDGTLLGAASTIATGQYQESESSLAVGATNSLFVWQSRNDPAITYGALISRSGAVTGPFQISQINSPSHNPNTVAFDGTNYFVIWNRDLNPSGVTNAPPTWNLDGRFVAQNGTMVGSEFSVVTSQTLIPTLAFDGSNYLLGGSLNLDLTNSNKNVVFRFYDRAGSAIGPIFMPFPTLSGTNTPLVGGPVFDGSRFGLVGGIGSVGNSTNGHLTGFYSGAVYMTLIPASYSQPTLTASNLTGSQFPLALSGTPGINYVIQAATNLPGGINWTSLITNSPTNGTFNFTDTSATNNSRFYRALKQ